MVAEPCNNPRRNVDITQYNVELKVPVYKSKI